MKTVYTLSTFIDEQCELYTKVFSTEQAVWDYLNKIGLLDKWVKNQDELDQALDERAMGGEHGLWIKIQKHQLA